MNSPILPLLGKQDPFGSLEINQCLTTRRFYDRIGIEEDIMFRSLPLTHPHPNMQVAASFFFQRVVKLPADQAHPPFYQPPSRVLSCHCRPQELSSGVANSKTPMHRTPRCEMSSFCIEIVRDFVNCDLSCKTVHTFTPRVGADIQKELALCHGSPPLADCKSLAMSASSKILGQGGLLWQYGHSPSEAFTVGTIMRCSSRSSFNAGADQGMLRQACSAATPLQCDKPPNCQLQEEIAAGFGKVRGSAMSRPGNLTRARLQP